MFAGASRCSRGTRITAQPVIDFLAAGDSIEDILEA
ncbi:MAG: DUF433 domain-containing protein [Opitutales bacterium]